MWEGTLGGAKNMQHSNHHAPSARGIRKDSVKVFFQNVERQWWAGHWPRAESRSKAREESSCDLPHSRATTAVDHKYFIFQICR